MKKRNRVTGTLVNRGVKIGLFAISLVTCALLNAGHAAGQSDELPAAPREDLVARGAYLAAAANCVSCHTASNGAPFAGGVAFSTPLGTLYSSNITQDMEAGIGKWTLEDLRLAIREGMAPHGRRLFPAFPYTFYTKISDPDIEALYAFLQTLKPEPLKPPENAPLFRQRWVMALWNWAFLRRGPYQHDTSKTDEWNRGAYLVESLGHCGACHSPRNAMMAESVARPLSGGTVWDEVTIGKVRRWSAINLTSGHDGLAAWSVSEIETYLKRGYSARAGTFGPMNAVIQNSTSKLNAYDLHAIAVFLKETPAMSSEGSVVEGEKVKAGQGLYAKYCEECHGGSGRGGIFLGPPLAGSAVVQSNDPSSLINIILYGPTIPKDIKMGGWETMKPYHDILDDSDIAALANYVRGSWNNRARSVGVNEVARQR